MGVAHKDIVIVDGTMPMNYGCGMMIRDEVPGDIGAIRAVVTSAFAEAPHASGTEAAIVEVLRARNALTVSLVAEAHGRVVGHVAFSPVSIGEKHSGWFGLGPVAVVSEEQRRGIARALIEAGLERLKVIGAEGCVVLGAPGYYRRFGFESDPSLRFPGAPAEYFHRLGFRDQVPSGIVEYHEAFY